MPNNYFIFKRFTIYQDKCAMKVGTDGVLLGAWIDADGMQRILDVGTGTGLIAIMLAQRTKAIIEAVEIDEDAALQARQNAEASPWHDRIIVYHTSFQEFALQSASRYDLIVSNPPYYHNALKATAKSRTTARHAMSLDYQNLIEYSEKLLASEGKLCMIVPYDMSNLIIDHACLNGLYVHRVMKVRSTALKQPSRIILEFSRTKEYRPHTSELTIMQDDSLTYTEEYKNLTAEYYLNFD